MALAALALLLCISPAPAQEPEDEAQEVLTPAMRQAEYNRLAEEMQKLAARNAWSGVERFYGQLAALEVPLEFDELVTGAHSARSFGDTKGSRDRLDAARKQEESRDVIEWLWEIDEAYGVVFLACDLDKKKRPTLEIASMPFDPNQAKSVKYAQEQIAEKCLFDGMLPGGKYTFGGRELDVMPKIMAVRMDMRSEPDEPRVVKSERPEREEKGRSAKD